MYKRTVLLGGCVDNFLMQTARRDAALLFDLYGFTWQLNKWRQSMICT